MTITVFPEVVSSSSGPDAYSITAASPNVLYGAALSLQPAIYRITCTSTTVAKVEFLSSAGTSIAIATTANGTLDYNLATACDRVRVWTDTGSNIVVTITTLANALNNNLSGSLDTVNSSGTYTGTSSSGYAYVAVFGGGGGGGGGQYLGYPNGGYYTFGGGGGASGGFASQIVQLTGNIPVTIGSFGNGGTAGGANGNSGGSTSFGNITVSGGGGGFSNSGYNGGAGGTAPTGGVAGGGGAVFNDGGGGGGTLSITPYTFIKTGSTGGGGGGGNSAGSGGGDGSIGTGGTGGRPNDWTGKAANGKAAGGGGGASGSGGAGTAGVVYVLKY